MTDDIRNPIVRPFEMYERYEQHEPGQAEFRWAVKPDEVPGLAIGIVHLTGPIHKTSAQHAEWEQVYLITRGSGRIHLRDQGYRIQAPATIIIPRGTVHSVELQCGEELEYAFVNQYR